MNTLVYWPQDENGVLLDDSSLDKVSLGYYELLDAVKQVFLENLSPEKIIAIYVIGSIPRGKAVAGVSDVDVIAVVTDEYEPDTNWIKNAEQKLAQDFPIISKAGLKIVKKNTLFETEIFRAFLIKTQGLCIWGKDIKEELPDFRPDNRLAFHKISRLRKYLVEAETKIRATDNPVAIAQQSRKIYKVILRTAALLVIEQEQKYSNDTYTCTEMFLKYYPQHRGFIDKLELLGQKDINDKVSVLGVFELTRETFLPLVKKWLNTYK